MSVFDEKAATWDDDPSKVERARVVAEAIGTAVPLSGGTRLMEYGAGTGLLSQELAEKVGPITLVDPSGGMREVIAAKVAAGALPAGSRIWDLDLSTDPLPDDRFDVVASMLVLHHIPDLEAALRGLAAILDTGGRLCLVDLVAEDGSFHGEGFAGHHGFDTGELAEQVRRAGLAEVEVREGTHHVEKEGRSYPLFLLTAVKPA